jgi:uncharacterized protein YkwD
LGQHHNHGSKHYAKTYWPYLPVLAVLVAGFAANAMLNRQHHSVLGYSTGISPQVMLAETNGERVTAHEPALQLSTQLTAAAQAKANDMARRDYWSHVTPDGQQPWAFITQAGYRYEAAGENLAYGFGTSDQVMTAWMNSPEHRANVLDADYQDVGFATANAPDYQGTGPETIVVAMYGEPIGMISPSTNTYASTPVPLGAKAAAITRLQLLDSTNMAAMAIAAVAGAALMLFFVRHALAWRRVLIRGEQFFIGHPLLDVFLVSLVVLCTVLAHAAGTIL